MRILTIGAGCRALLIFAAFFVIAAALYSNSIHSPFFLDDGPCIVSNAGIRLSEISWQGVKTAATSGPCPKRFIPNLSFALNYYFCGFKVEGFRAVNIFIHVCCAFSFFLLARLIFLTPAMSGRRESSEWVAFVAALLFLIHPLATNVASYVVQRMALMAALFYTLSFIFYIKARLADKGGKRAVFIVAAVAMFAAAIASKENAVIMPLVVLVFDLFFFRDASCKKIIGLLPFTALTLGLVLLLGFYYTGFDPFRFFGASDGISFYQRMLTQFRAAALYLALIALPLPSRMNLDWYLVSSTDLFHPISSIISVGFILSVLFAAIYSARRHRLLSFSVLWFFMNLLIEAVFPRDMMFEHRTYLPSMLIFLPISAVLVRLPRARIAYPVLAAICILLCAATVTRNRVFADDLTLWSDVMSKSPNNPRAYANLGYALARRGRLDEALPLLEKGARMFPDNAEVQANLGRVLQDKGRTGEALALYRKALGINFMLPEVHYNLGNIQARAKNYDVAAMAYHQALQINPDYVKAWLNLGNVFLLMHRPGDAETCYRTVLELAPGDAMAMGNLSKAVAMGRQGCGR